MRKKNFYIYINENFDTITTVNQRTPYTGKFYTAVSGAKEVSARIHVLFKCLYSQH